MEKEKIYWDADCCLKWIKKEIGFEDLKGTIFKAENNEIEIRTSAFSLVEVFYWKENNKAIKEKTPEIKKFFEEKYIVTIPLDIPIADLAREIHFIYGIDPADAIHIASALFDEINIFNTYNKHLLDKNGKIVNPNRTNDPPLIIIKPNINYQEIMFETKNE